MVARIEGSGIAHATAAARNAPGRRGSEGEERGEEERGGGERGEKGEERGEGAGEQEGSEEKGEGTVEGRRGAGEGEERGCLESWQKTKVEGEPLPSTECV